MACECCAGWACVLISLCVSVPLWFTRFFQDNCKSLDRRQIFGLPGRGGKSARAHAMHVCHAKWFVAGKCRPGDKNIDRVRTCRNKGPLPSGSNVMSW